MANHIDSLLIPDKKGIYYNRFGKPHFGFGGLKHPKHIAEFVRSTECGIVKQTDDGRFKLERRSQSSRRHLLKKYENRRFRHGMKKRAIALINEED